MTVGNPVSLIIKFMIPMCLGNLFQQFYNIADSIVAGKFIGVNALAAIGSTGSLMFFVTGWLNGLSSGFAIIVAQMFGAKKFDRMRHYVAMATNIVCDQEVRFDSGSLHEAIRASISIPMLFRPLRKDGMVLIDGGILNPLPLNHVHRTEGDILIAVDVNAPVDCGKRKKMSPYNLLTESSRMMMQQITRYQIERCQPDILIRMSGNAYDMLEFHHAESIVETGIEITRNALDRIGVTSQEG